MRASGAAGGPTAVLASFCATLRYEDMQQDERRAVTRHLLDTLGAMIAGAGGKVSSKVAALLAAQECEGQVPVPGRADRWTAAAAAYLGGVSAHGLELDDGYRAGSVHPGAPVVPAVLSLGHGCDLPGERLAVAIAVGYEATTRLAAAIHPRSRQRGYHNTPVAGVMGAAAAAGSVLGLDAERMEHALGLAASSAAGLFAFLEGGGEVKRLHPGFAAREGCMAALLARQGVTGPRGVLEAKDGFLQAFGGGVSAEEAAGVAASLEAFVRTPLNVTQCYIKPYACCRHIHPALDAVVVMRELADSDGRPLSAEAVERVEIATYSIAAAHAHGGWGEMAAAQLSYQFCVATALRFGGVEIAHFDQAALADPQTTALCRRIEVRAGPEADRNYPRTRPAQVVLRLKDGRSMTRSVTDPIGSPGTLPDERLAAKFLRLAEPAIGERRARSLVEEVFASSRPPSARRLLETACRPPEGKM